jgi:hypothetical protein
MGLRNELKNNRATGETIQVKGSENQSKNPSSIAPSQGLLKMTACDAVNRNKRKLKRQNKANKYERIIHFLPSLIAVHSHLTQTRIIRH